MKLQKKKLEFSLDLTFFMFRGLKLEKFYLKKLKPKERFLFQFYFNFLFNLLACVSITVALLSVESFNYTALTV